MKVRREVKFHEDERLKVKVRRKVTFHEDVKRGEVPLR